MTVTRADDERGQRSRKDVWAIRIQFQNAHPVLDLALFNLAIALAEEQTLAVVTHQRITSPL